MTRRFLKETPTAGSRSLSVSRHQVHDSWDQIDAYLRSALGPAHAMLFAEPFRGAGVISWMASSDVDPVPFDQLSPDRQQAALTRLQGLLGDISNYAAERSTSRNDEDRQWAALLDAIQMQPSAVPLTDRLFVAGDQPVLIQWGCRDDATVSTGTQLVEAVRMVEENRRNPQPVAPVVDPAAPVLAGTAVAGGWPWLLPALLWALFLATLAAIFYLLVAACAVQLPPSWQIFGSCAERSALADEQARHNALLDELRRLRGDMSGSEQCAVPPDPDLTWLPPAPLPDPQPEPIPPPPPEPEPEPQPEPMQEETDLDRAREQAGGNLGDVTITLLWNGHSDLDLILVCPDGSELTGANSGEGMRCGGRIDVDANFCATRAGDVGTVCTGYVDGSIPNPVENGYFVEAEAMRGLFQVFVRHYAAAADAPNTPIPFIVQLRRGEDRQRFEGTAQPGGRYNITSFQFD